MNNLPRVKTVNGYWIAGNDTLAIAISLTDPKDAHYFDPYTVESAGFELGAFEVAIAWTSPGL